MKKIFTILVAVLYIVSGYGANPYTVTFSGSGATLQTVHVENMTKGTSLDMNATDVLQLVFTTKVDNINANAEELKIYPNPMNQSCNIHFSNENAGNVNMQVIDLSGKTIFTYSRLLESGDYNFMMSGLTAGVYIVNLRTTTKDYTNKIISTNLVKAKLDFEEISSNIQQNASAGNVIQKAKAQQLTTVTMQYSPGDQLKFIGYAAGFANNTIYATPTATSTFTFNFVAPYYRLTGNTIASSQPCFVDIMFSVSDVNYKGVDNLANADFVVKEDGVIVTPTESFQYIKSINTVPYKIKTVLMIDNSTSIGTNLAQIKTAALGMINNIGTNQEMAVYSFSGSATLLQAFTSDISKLTAAVNSISLGYPTTDLFGSFITGVNAWSDLFSVSLIQKGFLVLFTDGDDTQASSTLQQALAARGQKSTYIIGFGSGINPNNLNSLANPSPYYSATNVTDLQQIFVNIQKDIYKFANSFYWLNYMTPKRTGSHSLQISVKSNTNVAADATYQGQFSAAGFQNVLSGTYVNIETTRLYGLDTIRCFYSTTGYKFTYDKTGITPYSNDSLILKPVTYWATYPPLYSWVNLKTTTSNLKTSNYSNVTLFPLVTVSDTARITLTDVANSFTKNLVLVVYSDFAGVTTATPASITSTTATVGGEVKSIGNSAVTSRGICWSTTSKPTITNSKLVVGSGKGIFSSGITGLASATQYYVRAFATNTAGTVYGNEVSFTTLAPTIPTVTTTTVSNIIQTSAASGGSVTYDNGATVTARGVCWSTTSGPTIALTTKTTDGIGIGSFSSTITGLTVGNTYYVRAYATNSAGTAYGAEVSFTTTLPTVTTTAITATTATTASSGGNVTVIGGTNVTARGVCWSTTSGPTIALTTKTSDGTGIGAFTSAITGLTQATTYYVRAYASNSIGTTYGAEVSFTTFALPTLAATTAASSITSTSASSGGNVAADGGSSITARGVCWSTSPNPTIALTTKTSDGTGIGSFTSSITGLALGTTYYVCAYATNIFGTTYGTQVTFTTLGLPTITTSAASSITNTSANSGGNVVSDGGATITARGICWSTTQNPTISNSKTTDGTGTGAFTSAITGLTNGIVYYVRAYATNSVGTNYGNQVSFSTLNLPNISYSTSYTFTKGSTIATITPQSTGSAVSFSAIVSTFAGSGTLGAVDGIGSAASFNGPSGVVVDAFGNVYVADQYNQKIRKITSAGVVSTFAGSGYQGATDATGGAATFYYPSGVAVDATGNIFVADASNYKIRKITSGGVVSTFAGSGSYGNTDGTGTAASFGTPYGIAVDAAGNVYVAEQGNNKIRKITSAGVVSTLAGSVYQGATDGTGTAARFYFPSGVAVDAAGNIFVADSYNHKIRKITPSGVVSTLAGSGSVGATDGIGTAASFYSPWGVGVDAVGNVYVADAGNQKIRKITPVGVVSTLAGSGSAGTTDGTGTVASFNNPTGVAVDAAGNVYVADAGNKKIRKISQLGYFISPALPAGLSFDQNTGVISGTPTVTLVATTYSVTAINVNGSVTATFTITVQ
jgi:hypothetical protein